MNQMSENMSTKMNYRIVNGQVKMGYPKRKMGVLKVKWDVLKEYTLTRSTIFLERRVAQQTGIIVQED